jgi:hypothetical protein
MLVIVGVVCSFVAFLSGFAAAALFESSTKCEDRAGSALLALAGVMAAATTAGWIYAASLCF